MAKNVKVGQNFQFSLQTAYDRAAEDFYGTFSGENSSCTGEASTETEETPVCVCVCVCVCVTSSRLFESEAPRLSTGKSQFIKTV